MLYEKHLTESGHHLLSKDKLEMIVKNADKTKPVHKEKKMFWTSQVLKQNINFFESS